MFKRNFLLIALVVALLVGCAGMQPKLESSSDRLALAKLSFTAVENIASDMREAGDMTDRTSVKIDPYFQQIRKVFKLADSHATNPDDLPGLILQINTLILDARRELPL